MAVRIPKEIALNNIKEFIIKKVGEKIILTPKTHVTDIDEFFDTLEKSMV